MRTCLLSLVITVSSEGILDNTLPQTRQRSIYTVRKGRKSKITGEPIRKYTLIRLGQITKSPEYSLRNYFPFASSQLHS